MAYTIILKASAEKELSSLPVKTYDRVVTKLLSLKENPRPSGVRKLRRREGYRVRVGDYRVLYTIDESKMAVEVVSIAHRSDIYRF